MAVEDTTIQANINNYYFKTRADFEAHANEILNNSTIYIENDGEYGNVRVNLLWENSDMTSIFSSQNITLSSGDYDYLIVLWKEFHNNSNLTADNYFTSIFKKGGVSLLSLSRNYETYDSGWIIRSGTRRFEFTSETVLNVHNAYTGYVDASGKYVRDTTAAEANKFIIPLQIYGAKIIPASSSGGGSEVSIVDWSLEVSE